MKVEYMRTAKKSYMILKEADYPFEQYELRMILQNDISCLLPFQTILADGMAQYWYDVSGMQSLRTRFSVENADGKLIRFLLENLIEMKSAMEEYLLDDANICLRADTIYWDRQPERIRFCYLPGLASLSPSGTGGAQEEMGFAALSEEILRHVNHADPAAVRMGYEMYERCARGFFTLEDCEECLRMGEGAAPAGPESAVSERGTVWQDTVCDFSGERSDFENEDVEFLLEEPKMQEGHRKKRRTDRHRRLPRDSRERERREEEELLFALCPDPPDVPGDLGRTEVIQEEDVSRAWELIYKGNGLESDLKIDGFPFLIGTDSRRVNGVLRARTVSRVHAKLYEEENRLYAEDFNSTNGTYVNRTLLPMNTPVELKEGDRIVFATEEYAVYCRRAVAAPVSQ